MVQPHVLLAGGLLRRDVRLGNDPHRQIDQRAIQGEQLSLEPEALARHGTTGLQPSVQQPDGSFRFRIASTIRGATDAHLDSAHAHSIYVETYATL